MNGPEDEPTRRQLPYPGPPAAPDPEPGYVRNARHWNQWWGYVQPILLGALTVGYVAALPFVEALQEPLVLGPSGLLISLLSAASIKRR